MLQNTAPCVHHNQHTMTHHPLRFIRRGQTVTLHNVPPDRTLLQVLREDLQACGTKEGCGEGDCGACTVVLAEAEHGALRFRAINSCIRLAHSIDGMALWTAEDIAQPDGSLHPAQEAMVQCHGSQCGFCTPGFVMSLFALYQNHQDKPDAGPVSRQTAQEALSGNLCRCTGYRPILDAAQAMASLPATPIDTPELLQKLELLALIPRAPDADLTYIAPPTLAELTAARAAHPQAQLVAGCTDVGLWVTKMHRRFDRVIDVTQAAELREISHLPGHFGGHPHHLRIGAAVPLADAFAALVAGRPQLHSFASRFAGLPVRNSGTLGGNVANGSPIGDSMPLLIALGASVVLASPRGERTLALEHLYTGYRQNVMAADEVLAFIDIPHPTAAFLRVYKISKRFDDDISAVCLALCLTQENGIVTAASIGVGGVAATPVRAVQTQAALVGQRHAR
jgi:xanthine dehydrogenase small subunit